MKPILIAALLTACGGVHPVAYDATPINDAAPPGDACVSQAGCSGRDASQPADASIADASIPQVDSWDIAYVNTYQTGTGFSFPGTFRIANTGTAPLDMSTLTVVSVTHTGPAVVSASLTLQSLTLDAVLQPGESGGHLISQAEILIVDAGLMTETLVDDTDYLLIVVSDSVQEPPFVVTAVIGLGSREATLNFDVLPLGFTTPTTATRTPAN
jgi:hypothetical protein